MNQKRDSDRTPGLLVPRHIFTKIAAEAALHPKTETGASFVGIETHDLMVILGVIPDEVNIERSPGLFVNGGEYQVELFRWYKKHWDMMRKESRLLENQISWSATVKLPSNYVPPELDFDLKYLGDWHKHPGSMTYLSSRDIRTIGSILSDVEQNRHQLLSPIVTKLSVQNDSPLQSHEVSFDKFRMTWYYSARNMTKPVGIKSFPISNSNLPSLPPVPWHLKDLRRFDDEIMYLGLKGYRVLSRIRDVDNDSICEVVFSIESPWQPKKYLVVTKWDYPESAPQIYQYSTIAEGDEGTHIDVQSSTKNDYIVDLISTEEGYLYEPTQQPLDENRRPSWLGFLKIAPSKIRRYWPRFTR